MDQGMTEQAVDIPVFKELLRRIEADAGGPITLASPRSFELLMPDNLPVRVTVHPSDTRLVVDIYLYNAQLVTGDLRTNLCQGLLLLNHSGLRGRPFALGLDRRDYVLLTASFALDDALLDEFTVHMDYLCGQAREIRELIEAVTLANEQIPVDMTVGAVR
ncbi:MULTISPECIES: type III secretion system chaperone [unclassified Variovorax]|jgi:hypothetical protein|uniref:type III secretion system chaperone n=1 Tax=unclassified Variovorax TaxID=663243 RepID=UPI0008C1EE80|nr:MULTISPECIES: type III secretion system chaperone [unclassified Variovorax]SEK06275.1 hypothetical protein SAMN05518853_107132 [Variovorax sp. OK202]SFD45775.1 hypothetical protein SAMN05444746_107132 [Variovorax sp. OK212]